MDVRCGHEGFYFWGKEGVDVRSAVVPRPARARGFRSFFYAFTTAAAPPPPPVIARMEEMGFQVTHVYGLTETYGPSVVSAWQEEWNELSPTEQALKKGRQGVNLCAK